MVISYRRRTSKTRSLMLLHSTANCQLPMRIPIVIFAQVPPPEHGQSRMVQRTLDALRANPDDFDVHHVNSRFSETLEDVGASSLGKLALSFKYLVQAVRLRMRMHDPVLLYVPGPANWSPLLRDWILLTVLRLLYRRVVFHWHAIGHGEWAHGSERLKLEGPVWLDRCARAVSRHVLEQPFASISVSESSCKDAAAVGSLHHLIVPNGIEDPCPDYEKSVEPSRLARLRELEGSGHPCFRILFLSHGTIEKGVLDAVQALQRLLERRELHWCFAVTFAGGLSEEVEIRFEREIEELERLGSGRITVRQLDYVSGVEKRRCYLDHDIFLSPSRWESFGLTVLEAMAYGMRIVATASDGVQGVLPPAYPYLAPVRSPDDLADRLQECCSNLLASRDCGLELDLRQRYLSRYQLKDFKSNLTTAFRGLGEKHSSFAFPNAAPGQAPVTCRNHGSETEDEEPAGHAHPVPLAGEPLLELSTDRSAGVLEQKAGREATGSVTLTGTPDLRISVYLADQNPGHDRSFGISRMSQVVLQALNATQNLHIETVVSKTSQQAPGGIGIQKTLPWGTRRKWIRLMTDHLHPLFPNGRDLPEIHYFPKGYLPLLHQFCRPSVVTIHDTIIQYDEDHYPLWRKPWEYAYWSWLLKHTLRHADRIMTVSESSKQQIKGFMKRHSIPSKEITVTYEPCAYEQLPQPDHLSKENHVIHLASREPHKRSAHLVRWWHEAENIGRDLPALHLIGTVPPEVEDLLTSSRTIVKRPFLNDTALQAAYRQARALILPSEIEGFGLPALEAYYLGTPVCYVKGTSVEEVLAVATGKGGFALDDMESLYPALNEIMAMSPQEVCRCGLKLRETYAAEKVVEKMMAVFHELKN
jgi:glycosyltransferase involved in cell wall biosynthesis